MTQKHNQPHVFIIAALSADGFLADQVDRNSLDWTSTEDKRFFRDRTKEAGVLVMGSKTFETIGKPLPGRINIVYSSNPDKFETELTDELPAYESWDRETLTHVTSLEPEKLIELLSDKGYPEVAIGGGASIYSQFMASGVVDSLYLTYEPVIFGRGVKLFDRPILKQLELVRSTPLSAQTILNQYRPKAEQP